MRLSFGVGECVFVVWWCLFLCLVGGPLACEGWQYGPQYSYPCELTNGFAWGHFSNGLTNYIWPAQDLDNKWNVIPSTYNYRSGHNVTWAISSVYGMTLKGFMLQAFDKHDRRVGTWSLATPTGVQPSTAAIPVANTMCATNNSNTLVQATSLSVTAFNAVWTPPPKCCTGAVRFNVMIMQMYNMYWVYNINLHEDNSTQAPEPVQSLQVGDSWANSDNTTSASIIWLPPTLSGGGGNKSVTVSSYIMTVYLGNTKVQSQIINGSLALPGYTGYVTATINHLQPFTTYTVSVAAQSIVSMQVATQNLGAIVAAGVTLTGTVTNATLLTPKLQFVAPTAPENVTITYMVVPTTNNVASQLNTTGVGSGVTAVVTYQLNSALMASLQLLGIFVKYYPVDSPGDIVTYAPPSLPVAVKGVYTINVPMLLPSTEYKFGLTLHTSGQQTVSTNLISPGTTPGCLNSCSGVGYCHPQLVLCHCPQGYLGPDCSIPVQFWDCEFSKPYDTLCITWALQGYNMSTNAGELYFRVRGDIEGGYFSIIWGVWLQDGMHNGVGWNIWVNPLTNETGIAAPKGQPELRPNHAQKPTANGFIGFYNQADSTSDLQWWFQVVNPANLANQYPFYNITPGIGQQYNASWCRGPGIMGGHDVFHRGKMYMSIADNLIIKVGNDPDFVVSFMPFYITTSIFVAIAIVYQYWAGAAAPGGKQAKSKNAGADSVLSGVTSFLQKPIVPAALTEYFLLPAQNLSLRFQLPEFKFMVLWSVRLFDLVTFNFRRAVGEMLGLDLVLVLVYFIMVLAFMLTMINQYNNIQWGLPANTAYGYIIFWHLTLMFIPISKHSLLLYAFRIPYERAIKYHRWISRMSVVWIAAHFYTESYNYYNKLGNIQLTTIVTPTLWTYLSMTDRTEFGYGHLYGFIAGCLALGIFVTSLTVVRRYLFASFYVAHILAFPGFIVMAAMHHYYTLYFAVPPLGLWVMDHAIRWCRILWFSSRAVLLKYWRVRTSKHVRQTIRLDLPAKGMKTGPGQYAFLCIPSMSFMWHPFSISSSNKAVQLLNDELVVVPNDTLSFHVLGMGAMTFSERLVNLGRKLHNHDSDMPSKLPIVLVDGPYGEISVDTQQYSNLMIVAGGIGATAFMGLLNDILVEYIQVASRKVPLQHVRFIWVTRDSSSFRNCSGDLLDAMLALPALVSVQLFETDSIEDNEYGFEMASSVDLLKEVRSSSQLVPADLKNAQSPTNRDTRASSMEDLKTEEQQRFTAPQVPLSTLHEKSVISTRTNTQVVFHLSAYMDGASTNGAAHSGFHDSHDNRWAKEGDEEEKATEQQKKEHELKVDAQSAAPASTSGTMDALAAVSTPPASPRSKRYPVIRSRPDWSTVFAEADNAIGSAGPSSSTAVLVCGPQGLVAAVQEHSSKRNWPVHKEFFYI